MKKISPFYMQDIKQREMEIFRKPDINLQITARKPISFAQGETIRDFESKLSLRS